MGGTLISIAVAWGDAVIVAGVTDPSGEEQAVKMNSPIIRIFGVLFMGSIGYRSNFNTYGWLLPFLQTRHKKHLCESSSYLSNLDEAGGVKKQRDRSSRALVSLQCFDVQKLLTFLVAEPGAFHSSLSVRYSF